MDRVTSNVVEGVARVVAIADGRAILEAEPASACGGCKSKAGCGTTYAGSGAKRRFAIANDFDARIGELVVIGMAVSTLTRATAIAYVLPLVAMVIAGIGATLVGASDAGTAAAAILGLVGGVAIAKRLAGAMATAGELDPVFLRRAPDGGDSCPSG